MLMRPDLDFFSADALSPIFLACQYTEDTDFPVSSAISDAKWSSYISRTIRFCSSVHVLLMLLFNDWSFCHGFFSDRNHTAALRLDKIQRGSIEDIRRDAVYNAFMSTPPLTEKSQRQ